MRGNHPLLAQLCRHIVSARRVAHLVERVANDKVLDLKDLSALLQLQAAKTASIMRAETTRHPTAQLARPWDDEE